LAVIGCGVAWAIEGRAFEVNFCWPVWSSSNVILPPWVFQVGMDTAESCVE
jgi:hypothetical protein